MIEESMDIPSLRILSLLLHVTHIAGQCIQCHVHAYLLTCNHGHFHRHSEEMIKKLCSAGLGFYVREDDTQQKLGISCKIELHIKYFDIVL